MSSTTFNDEIKHKKKTLRGFITLAALGAILLFAGIVFLIVQGEERDSRIEEQYVTINNLATALDDQKRQFEDCMEHSEENPISGCDQPVSSPSKDIVEDSQESAIPVTQGPQGAPGPGPSETQVLLGITRHCAPFNNCIGQTGPIGETVQGPPGLVGDTGPIGGTGTKGDQGEPGRPPTPEEILEAVTELCATGACNGPPGADGKDGVDGVNGNNGTNGTDGRGVSKVNCVDGIWEITYTDGTTSTTGACVLTPPVESPPPVEEEE